MLLKLLSYLPSILGLLIVGLITYLKNTKDAVHVLFFLLAGSIATWLLALFVGDLTISHVASLWALRVAVGVGTLIVPALLYFSAYFPRSRRVGRLFHALVLGPAICFVVLAPTPWLVPDVQLQALSAQPSGLNLLYTLQSLYVVGGFVVSFGMMLRKLRGSNARERVQIKLVIMGLLTALLINFIVGFILEMTGQATTYSNLAGGLSLLAFIGTTAYAIIRHRLFDIRLAITRTLAYIVAIGVVSGAYSLLVIGIGVPLVTGGSISLTHDDGQLLLLLPPTILVALTFQSLQRSIARLTSGIFYNGSYDTRATLDAFSDALISDNDINAIMAKGLAVLGGAVKPSHALLIVLDEKGKTYRQQALNRQPLVHPDDLVTEAARMKGRMAVKDEVPAGRWPRQYEQEDISLALRLGTSKNLVGVLFLGPKQDGRIYSGQDTGLLNVSAKNFAVAIENTKKYQQIAAFADTMHQEVLKATARLRKANAELRTLDAMKDDFISMASHQLRSPATSVHEAVQMLLQDYISEGDRKHIIELAEASSERLVNVVTDMLSIARIQAGHFTLEKTEINMAELVNRAILETSGLASQRRIRVQFQAPRDAIEFRADRAKLNEIIANYIENAIKYSHEDTTVTIALRRTGNKVYFEVTDTGIGVPASERKGLFTKFYRTTNARKEQPNGNGIGLFVVKTVAREHGGDAYYEPREPGSMFGFWLPYSG